jgi:hypothetical protein
VRVNGKEGFVGKKYVNVSGSAATDNAVPADAVPEAGSRPAPHLARAEGEGQIHKPEGGQSGGFAKRSAPPPPKPGGSGKAHKGVEEE